MNAPLAIVRDPVELHRLLRARAEALDISREAIDELAGLPKGYAAKLLCEPPVKHLGPISFFPLAGALGFAIALVEDEQRKPRISRTTKRKPGGPRGTEWRNARYLAIAADYGRNGAKELLAKLPKEKISTQRSRAAKSRWRKWKRRLRDMKKNPELMRKFRIGPGGTIKPIAEIQKPLEK